MFAGDLKLRVRNLEGERAAKKASIMQQATINSIACAGFLNVGVQLALDGRTTVGGGIMTLAAALAVTVALALRRVKRLNKFEDGIKGRGSFPSS